MSTKNLSSMAAFALLLLALSHVSASAQNRVTVMMWNVHGGNPPTPPGKGTFNCAPRNIPDPQTSMMKIKNVVQMYNNSHPTAKIDAITLQEVHRNQAVKLAQLLKYPAPHFIWAARCDKTDRQLDYGTAILTPHKFALKTYYNIHTPKADRERNTPEYTRLVLGSFKVHGQWVRVYSAHLTSNPVERQKQLDDIFKRIPPAGIRSVLTGDFNMPPTVPGRNSSATYDSVTRNFIDTWAKKNPTNLGGGITAPYRETPQRIDYIFLRKLKGEETGFNILSSGVINTGRVSDHLPVVTVLTFKSL